MAHRQVILFGLEKSDRQKLDDTWVWEGSSWKEQHPMHKPPPRSQASLAYDAARSKTVLFGGNNATDVFSPMNDTWLWDGTDWEEQHPTMSPPKRDEAQIAYDAARQNIMLFGGRVRGPQGLAASDETWSWDGKGWTEQHPAHSPSAHAVEAVTYDGARKQSVYFGAGPGPSETWIWNGADWSQLHPSANPTSAQSRTMSFDTARNRVFLLNDYGSAPELWSWDGSTWTQQHVMTTPQPCIGATATYEQAKQMLLRFGGVCRDSPEGYSAEVWGFDGKQWRDLTPP
jgi:hypothetical protein